MNQDKEVVDYLNVAYQDYLAARVLLNADLLVQGSILASTAIEKYLKAILFIHGTKRKGHLKKAYFQSLRYIDTKLWSTLNIEFIELLQKLYSLRYLDSLTRNFNAVIIAREFLAELDFTAISMQSRFGIENDGIAVKMKYHSDLQAREPKLFLNNHVLLNLQKQEFISSSPQSVYAVRNCPDLGLIEVTYTTENFVSDGCFRRPGLISQR